METWSEFKNALCGMDEDEEMIPAVLPEPHDTLVWVGDSVMATMDDEVTGIAAQAEIVEQELQVSVMVKMLVGTQEQVLAGIMLFDQELDVVVVHEFETESHNNVRVLLSEQLEESIIDIVRDAVRDGMPQGIPVTLCESLL